MLSVQDLYLSAKKLGISKLKLEQYRVKIFTADIGDNYIHYIIPVDSYTTPGERYMVNILFTPVTFLDDETEYKRIINAGREKYGGMWYYFIKPTNYTPTQVSCTCKDYIYSYAYYNAKHGSHYGSLPVIPPPKGVRPPRNPQHLPGMCKHIAAAMNATWGKTRISLPKS